MSIELVMPSNHLILCHPLPLLPSIFPSIRDFSNESVLCIRWPKYWSFSFNISPSNEHQGLISFRMDRLDLLAVGSPRDSQESSPAPQFKSINSLVFSFLYNPNFTSIHDHWKNHSRDFRSVQFSSVAQSCPTLCDPMNHSTPGLPVHHHLLEFTQTQRPSSQ